MSDFPLAPLGTLISSPIADGPHTTPDFLSEGIPFLSVDGIQDGELVFDKCRFISPEDHDEFSKKAKPQKGDVLMGKAASTGKIALVRTDFEFSIWSPLAIIRPNDAIISDFLAFALKSIPAQIQIDNLCSYNTQKNIAMSDIPRIRIPLPPLETQHRIADYLDRETAEIDAAVADLDRYVGLLEKRLAHFVSESLDKDSFPAVPVFTLAALSAGAGITAESIEDSGKYPVYGGNGLRGYTETFNQSVDRILIGRQGALCGNVHYAPGPLFASEHALVVNPRASFNLVWLEHALRDLNLRTLSQASAQPGISASEVSRQRVHLPPREKQDAIAQLISNEVKRTHQIIEESIKLRNLLLKRRSVLITEVVTGRKQV